MGQLKLLGSHETLSKYMYMSMAHDVIGSNPCRVSHKTAGEQQLQMRKTCSFAW